MSDTKHEVTVYDRAPSTMRISVAQVEAYLRRTGWTLVPVRGCGHVARHSSGSSVSVASFGNCDKIAGVVVRVAQLEGRQPSAVLADIAREPAS